MDLVNSMDQLRARLGTIDGLRTFEFGEKVTPPGAVVALPDQITFDETYARGADSMQLVAGILVGRTTDRAAWRRVAAYAAGSGSSSVKAVLESGTYTAFDYVTVTGCRFDVWTKQGTQYLVAAFDLDVVGSGSA